MESHLYADFFMPGKGTTESFGKRISQAKNSCVFSTKCIDKSLYYDIIQSNHRKHI